LFKTIPVKKQGKYNLNVQLQDLSSSLYKISRLTRNDTVLGLITTAS